MGDGEIERGRADMLERQLRARGVTDPRVLEAFAAVPREDFVSEEQRSSAYADHPLPIGSGQTISQPYVVGWMAQLAIRGETRRCLDVGTGCGYQAAILARLFDHVFSIEVRPELAASAETRLAELGYENISVRVGDGSLGWPEAGPFDAIVCACAPAEVPPALVDQLAPGGSLVLPVGTSSQQLVVVHRDRDTHEITQTSEGMVAFLPMI